MVDKNLKPGGRIPLVAMHGKIFDYVKNYFLVNGFSPTLQEIADYFSTDDTKFDRFWAQRHLKSMHENRMVIYESYKHRGTKINPLWKTL